MKTAQPYFFTWTAQSRANSLEIDAVDSAHFILKGGQKVLDLSCINFNANFGHTPEFVFSAIKEQSSTLPLATPNSLFPLKREVSQMIGDKLGIGKGRVFFTTGGAESVENAIKMARLIRKKTLIATRHGSYHGATLGALSISDHWRAKEPPTVDQWTLFLPNSQSDPEAKLAKKAILDSPPENIAGICLETITGAHSLEIPPASWYANIQAICREFSIPLILDEVACGFYRTGKSFAFHHYPELAPDLVCLAKAITGGCLPFGAVWMRESLAARFDEEVLPMGLTNYAYPLGLAATRGVFQHMETPEFQTALETTTRTLQSELQKLDSHPKICEIRNIGPLAAIEHTSKATLRDFTKSGVYLVTAEGRLILAPPLNLEADLLKEGIEKVSRVLEMEMETK